jgi:hypothetical protein
VSHNMILSISPGSAQRESGGNNQQRIDFRFHFLVSLASLFSFRNVLEDCTREAKPQVVENTEKEAARLTVRFTRR